MAGLIPPTTVEQIRAASDIVEVIGAAVPLKRAGANFQALCPFHREKTPSFTVNPQKQIFYCFGCHKGGDVFKFLQEHESLSFIEAVKRLAERAHITLTFDEQPGMAQAQNLKDKLYKIHDEIARRWQTALATDPAGQIARDYLEKRGVSAEAVHLFHLGYAPEVWDDTVNWGKSKGHTPEIMEQSGLVIRKEGTDRYYDRFRGRLMFPICDEQGRIIAFSGRILSGDEKTAKYVNSPETPIFSKGRVFYGLDKSKRAILDAGFAVVCEGQLDLIACFMAGVRNIVAPQGTAFTSDHARILKRYVNEVVLCFDSDNAGQNAAVRVFDSLLAAEMAIRVAVVPAPHDPDSFIKEKGGGAFQELITRAEGFFDFLLKRLCATHDQRTDAGRKAVVQQMREAVWKTNDLVLSDVCAQKTAQALGVASEAVRAEFRKGSRPKPSQAAEEIEPVPTPSETLPPQEEQLLKLLLSTDDFTVFVAEQLKLDWVPHSVARRIVATRLRVHLDQGWTTPVAFLAEFMEDPEAQILISRCLTEDRPIPHPEKQIVDVVRHLRNQDLSRQIHELSQRVRDPSLSEEQRAEMLRKQQELRLLKNQACIMLVPPA